MLFVYRSNESYDNPQVYYKTVLSFWHLLALFLIHFALSLKVVLLYAQTRCLELQ